MTLRLHSVSGQSVRPGTRLWRGILPAWVMVAAALAWPASVFSQAPALAQGAAIASAHPLATRAGHEILEQGGNAFDAAVAVAAVLAVVEPYSSGLGGGGFWLLHRARDAHQVMIDSREVAPRNARPGLYLDSNGRPIPGATRRGGKAVAVPGVPAALDHISRHYGSVPLSVSLAPAIRQAREGFAVGARFARIAKLRERLRSATVVEHDTDEHVGPGSIVEVADEDGETLEVTISSAGGVSTDSPLGAALMGATVGAVVEVNAPRGPWKARVLSIRRT